LTKLNAGLSRLHSSKDDVDQWLVNHEPAYYKEEDDHVKPIHNSRTLVTNSWCDLKIFLFTRH